MAQTASPSPTPRVVERALDLAERFIPHAVDVAAEVLDAARVEVEAVELVAAVSVAAHQARALENRKILRHRGLRHSRCRGQLPHRRRAAA